MLFDLSFKRLTRAEHVRGRVASSNSGAHKAHETRKASRGEAKHFTSVVTDTRNARN